MHYRDSKRDLIFGRWKTSHRFFHKEGERKRIREDAARTLCIMCARLAPSRVKAKAVYNIKRKHLETRDDLHFNSAYIPASRRGETSKLRVYARGINYGERRLARAVFEVTAEG